MLVQPRWQARQRVWPPDEPLRVVLEPVSELGSSLLEQPESPVAAEQPESCFHWRDRRHRHRALRCPEAQTRRREQRQELVSRRALVRASAAR